jgi:hypothetical protein
MRPFNRPATSAEPQAAAERQGPRAGAWYADPYAVAALRWWDGSAWTGQVPGPVSENTGSGETGGSRDPAACAETVEG